MPENNWILVGIAHGAHGVRGQLRVEGLSDNPARFAVGGQLYACLPQRPPRLLTIQSATPHRGKLLIAFVEVQSREAAQQLLGAQLMAEPDDTALPQGQYYHYQLLGLQVYERGEYLGELVDILARPANDVYVARNPEGSEIWIPALKTVVKNIDLEAKRMDVELPQGL